MQHVAAWILGWLDGLAGSAPTHCWLRTLVDAQAAAAVTVDIPTELPTLHFTARQLKQSYGLKSVAPGLADKEPLASQLKVRVRGVPLAAVQLYSTCALCATGSPLPPSLACDVQEFEVWCCTEVRTDRAVNQLQHSGNPR